MRYERLLARLFSQPLMAEPVAAATVAKVLLQRAGATSIHFETPGGARLLAEAGDDGQAVTRMMREYEVRDGVAIVPIVGELAARSMALEPMSGLTGYNAIAASLRLAAVDADVKGIMLDVDSPGGESGCFDVGRLARSISADKPVWAMVGTACCSAAYAIASGAARITAPGDGKTGSIGVVGLHTDLSGALAKEGVKVTIMTYGALKADGNPFEPLPPEARARWQADIDFLGSEFVRLVADHRGLTQKAVRATEADVFFGARAQELGLVDAVQPQHEALQEFTQFVNRGAKSSSRPAKGMAMSHASNGPAGQAAADNDLDARLKTARDEGYQAGLKDGRVQATERMSAILTSPEATERMPTAMTMALKTDLPAAQAIEVLASTPKAVPAAAAAEPSLAERMAAAGNPNVGPGTGGAELSESEQVEQMAAGILKFSPRSA